MSSSARAGRRRCERRWRRARARRRCERYERRRRALAYRMAALREDGTEEDARAARRAADAARGRGGGEERCEDRVETLGKRDALMRERARQERPEAERLAPVLVGVRRM